MRRIRLDLQHQVLTEAVRFKQKNRRKMKLLYRNLRAQSAWNNHLKLQQSVVINFAESVSSNTNAMSERCFLCPYCRKNLSRDHIRGSDA